MSAPIEMEDLNLDRNRARCIGLALIRTRGQQKAAAELVGLSPRALNYVLTHNGLAPLVEIGQSAAIDEPAARVSVEAFAVTFTPVTGR